MRLRWATLRETIVFAPTRRLALVAAAIAPLWLLSGSDVGMGGGVCACSTCHVYVKQGLDALSVPNDREEDIMDKAFDVRANSRLGCQSKILRDVTVVCEISRESRKAFLDEHPEIRKAGERTSVG